MYKAYYLLYIFCNSWMYCSLSYAYCCSVFVIFVDVFVCYFYGWYAFVISFFDYLVVNVGEVLDKCHFISDVFKVVSKNVKDDERSCISYVEIVVYGRSAWVHLDLAFFYLFKFFFFHSHGVVYFHDYPPFVYFKYNCINLLKIYVN